MGRFQVDEGAGGKCEGIEQISLLPKARAVSTDLDFDFASGSLSEHGEPGSSGRRRGREVGHRALERWLIDF